MDSRAPGMQPVMKSLILIVGLLTALLGFDGALATSSLPNLVDIREIDGAPAACLPLTDAEAIDLQEAYVVESSPQAGEERRQWRSSARPMEKPMLLHPRECVVFDRPVSGYSQGGGLKQVEEGRTYTFCASARRKFQTLVEPRLHRVVLRNALTEPASSLFGLRKAPKWNDDVSILRASPHRRPASAGWHCSATDPSALGARQIKFHAASRGRTVWIRGA